MMYNKYIRTLIIIISGIILFNCLHSLLYNKNNAESFSNCNSEQYYKILDDLENEVNNIYKQFQTNKENMEKTMKLLRSDIEKNVNEAKKVANEADNVSKKKASTKNVKSLNKGKTIDKNEAKKNMKSAKY